MPTMKPEGCSTSAVGVSSGLRLWGLRTLCRFIVKKRVRQHVRKMAIVVSFGMVYGWLLYWFIRLC